jgi:hypothetical protein
MMKRGWMKCYKMAGRYGEPFAAKEFFFDIYLLSDRVLEVALDAPAGRARSFK